MKKVFNFLNGKKTIIGAFASLVIGFLQLKGYIDNDTAMFLYSASGLLLGIGVVHKGVKAKQGNDTKVN
ncbi:MAG: hypothetical protein KC589_09190 [Nanoarchaeota archaeon]|nr:hypothetical protein [Nanoarchaeota archaeon]